MRFFITSIAQREEHELRVLTYNVLAQSLIPLQAYVWWADRYYAQVEQLRCYNADILCLQEVDEVRREWKSLFRELGLVHWFVKAPGKSHGVVLAHRRSKFRLVTDREVRYSEQKELAQQSSSENVGAAIVLDVLSENRRLVVATTHLFFHVDADYERARQLALLLSTVNSLKRAHKATGVIVAADFNTIPGAPAYQLLTTGKFDDNAKKRLISSATTSSFFICSRLSRSLINDPKAAVESLVKYVNELCAPPLVSSYASIDGAEPELTFFTSSFRGTLDYIMVSTELTPVAVLKVPTMREIGPGRNTHRLRVQKGYPSDHLPLAANIQLS